MYRGGKSRPKNPPHVLLHWGTFPMTSSTSRTFQGTLSETDLGLVAATQVLSWKVKGPVLTQFSNLLIQSGGTLLFRRLVAAN